MRTDYIHIIFMAIIIILWILVVVLQYKEYRQSRKMKNYKIKILLNGQGYIISVPYDIVLICRETGLSILKWS
jgi:hypothetical protein